MEIFRILDQHLIYEQINDRREAMTQDYIKKLEEIMDDTVVDISKKSTEQVNDFFATFNIKFDEYYAYFLQNHGNDYIKDEYVFRCQGNCDVNEGIEYEVDMFFGLEGKTGNLVDELKRYEQTLPKEVFSIADMPGGDLVCMQKETGKIYFWFHEENEENLKFVAESFKNFIMCFEKATQKERVAEPINFSINPKMDKLLREAAKKFQK